MKKFNELTKIPCLWVVGGFALAILGCRLCIVGGACVIFGPLWSCYYEL